MAIMKLVKVAHTSELCRNKIDLETPERVSVISVALLSIMGRKEQGGRGRKDQFKEGSLP